MARQHRHQEFAVIGLGRFGTSVALTLVERGFLVMGVDRNPELVQRVADQITQAVVLDSTDEHALQEIGINAFETVVVAIGSDFENNLLTAVALKTLGVRNVVCKALNQRQKQILLRVGVDRVVLPEHDAGRRLAQSLTAPGVLDQLELAPGYTITELSVPRSLIGRTVEEADLRRRFGINILVIKHDTEMKVSPTGDYRFAEGDLLVVFGSNVNLSRLHDLL